MANFIKSAYSKINKGPLVLGAVCAGLLGPHIWIFGFDGLKTGGIAGFFAAAGGVCASFLFFAPFFWCVYNMRGKIKAFLSVFRDLKFLALVLGLNFAAVLYLALSRQIYFWDNAGYWESAAAMSKVIFADPGLFLADIAKSIFTSDYNQLPAALPALVMAVFGAGRLVFVLSVLNFYFVPFLAFLYKTAKSFSAFIIVLLCLPMTFYLTLLGFLDVGGVFLSVVVLYIYLFRSPEPGVDFFGGVVLCVLMLFRRWYLFFAAAFVLCAAIYALVFRGGKIKKTAFTFLGFLSPLLIFFPAYLANRVFGKNYADMYSAYKFSFGVDIKIFTRYFGILLILALTGYVIYAAAKKKESFKSTIFLYAQFAAVFFMFVLIQTHGQQHLLLYAPIFALILINAAKDSKRVKIVLTAVSVLCFTAMFLPFAQPASLREITSFALVPSFSIYPQAREDASTLTELAAYVKNLDGDVAILASSFVLNADLLAKTEASLNFLTPLERSKNIAYLPDVDKRDGKPYNIVYVKYIVIALPIQTHLDPKDQLSVVIPAQMLTSDTPFAAAFEKLDVKFTLKDGVQAYIYERLRPNTEEEIDEVWEMIDAVNLHSP